MEKIKFTKTEVANDYIRRINKALQFVDENLDRDLTLEIVSEIAHYSPFHFHRIFKAITKETLNAYLIRKRIEKTASILFRKKEIPISEISLKYGFNSNSSFTRSFKKFYGVSPTEFRNLSPSKFSKICKTDSKIGQKRQIFEEYICNINNLKNWIKMNAKVEIKEMPTMALACVNHIGNPDLVGEAYEKLIKWAGPKGLMSSPGLKMLTIYHDSIKITDPGKVRMSACIVLDEPIETQGEIASLKLESQKCIVGHFEIVLTEFEKAWNSLFIWMNENGYKTAEKNPFEIYLNNYNEHPEKKCLVELCIPVE